MIGTILLIVGCVIAGGIAAIAALVVLMNVLPDWFIGPLW